MVDSEQEAAADAEPGPSSTAAPPPTAALIIGMAGSGKTTLVQRFTQHLQASKNENYVINLDPAVHSLPYHANIDIRDTVNYKNVMKEYKIGPNGGILTSCNLFATRFDQVMQLLEKPREPPLDTVLLDTAGQIEIFTWSASGSIITEVLASSMPTVIVYVVDTTRCMNPQTFMSNMMQACSILYKTRLPLVLAFNKVDVVRPDFALKWMMDLSALQDALEEAESYAATLSRSLALVLEEFYQTLQHVSVSSMSGEGMDDLLQAIEKGREDYNSGYKVDLEERKKKRQEEEVRRQAAEMEKVRTDIMTGNHGDVRTVIPGRGDEAAFNDQDQTEGSEDHANDMEEPPKTFL